MKLENLVITIAIISLTLIIVGGVYEARHSAQDQLQNYQECKAHTTDLEWCFKQFNPQLN